MKGNTDKSDFLKLNTSVATSGAKKKTKQNKTEKNHNHSCFKISELNKKIIYFF